MDLRVPISGKNIVSGTLQAPIVVSLCGGGQTWKAVSIMLCVLSMLSGLVPSVAVFVLYDWIFSHSGLRCQISAILKLLQIDYVPETSH